MKLGRNDPCSCGSGKKYKNCCLGKAEFLPAEPSSVECNQLVALSKAGHFPELESRTRSLLGQYPDSGFVWKLLGESLYMQGKDALHALQKTTELLPNDADAFANLGIVQTNLGQLNAAVASCRRALEIKPDSARAHNNLGNALSDLGQHEDALASYRRALEIQPDYVKAQSNLLFTLNYTADHATSYSLAEAREYGRKVSEKVIARFSTWHCSDQPQRLRVGMVSGDLNNHPVGFFLESLLMHLDPDRVELIAYPSSHITDALTTRIKPYFAAWKPLYGLNDEAAAQLIHADGVHVLLDLSGHTAKNRLPVFAWKPAPVQAGWLGYLATTGVAEMDYFLADKVGVPETQRQQFTESIWYLPDSLFCFTAPKVDLPIAPLPALSNGMFTFGCFQNLTRVNDDVLTAWGRIFAALPNARLRMQSKQLSEPSQRKKLAQRLQRYGITPSRVTMHGPIHRDEYLAAYAEVDFILDTFPYAGCTTTCEALWMGVPTLTLAGVTLLSRQGASILTAAGMREWVTTSVADYIDKTVTLTSDLPKLAALRSGLRERASTSPLFDAKSFARNFEAALWGMYQTWNDK